MGSTDSKERSNCRLCESLRIQKVLGLAPMPIGDAYLPRQMRAVQQKKYPVEVYLCRSCGHVQLGQVVDPRIVYGNYIYRSADSLGLVKHFQKYADAVLQQHNIPEKSLVVEIGSNDGSLLSAFKSKGMRVLGIDPAKTIAAEATAAGILTMPELFSESVAQKIRKEYGLAWIVIANNVIANIDDLHEMMKGIKHLLADDGMFICETGYLMDLLEKNILDNIYHEHISYFSVKPLQQFFAQFGMRLRHIEHVATKGGSLRCTVVSARSEAQTTAVVEEMIAEEIKLKIHKPAAFAGFEERMHQMKTQLHGLLAKLHVEGKTVAGYGASVGVTTVLYNLGIDETHIRFLVDDNTQRQNLFSPGLHIPVLGREALQGVDYCIIFAWQYNEPIIAKNKEFLESGGKFVTLLPEFQVVEKTQPI